MKALKITLGILLFILLTAYLSLWAYSAKWFAKEIDRVYADAATESNLEFLGPQPALTNFPFVPEIRYTGGIKTGNAEILFPKMIVRGYPMPWTTLAISFPQGVSLGGIVNPSLWSLSYLEAEIAVPYKLPRDISEGSMRAWKEADGKIDIRHYDMVKSALTASGKGLFTLDDNLQPVFRLESRIAGYEMFIQQQQDSGALETFPAAIAKGMMASLARPDEKTGENVVNITASVENRTLRVGPIMVLEFPEILWGTHTPPDLRL